MNEMPTGIDRASKIRKAAIIASCFLLLSIIIVGPPEGRASDEGVETAVAAQPQVLAEPPSDRPFPTLREPRPRTSDPDDADMAWRDREETEVEQTTDGPPGL